MQFTYDIALDIDNMRKEIDVLKTQTEELRVDNINLKFKIEELENKLEETNREMGWAVERIEDNIRSIRYPDEY